MLEQVLSNHVSGLREELRQELRNLHVDMLRQFHSLQVHFVVFGDRPHARNTGTLPRFGVTPLHSSCPVVYVCLCSRSCVDSLVFPMSKQAGGNQRVFFTVASVRDGLSSSSSRDSEAKISRVFSPLLSCNRNRCNNNAVDNSALERRETTAARSAGTQPTAVLRR